MNKKQKERRKYDIPELGEPFEAAGLNTSINSADLRVIPSQFRLPEYPAGLSLIRPTEPPQPVEDNKPDT